MVSNRTRYVSESTTDEETGDMEYLPDNQENKTTRKPTRTPKCFSKNALMARENRLKKKMYINSLESQVASLKNDNKKLTHVVDKQSFTIETLRKEVKYIKSILANSEGIGKLIRAINCSTGMAVTTSLDKNLALNAREVNKTPPIAQKIVPEVVDMVKKVDMVKEEDMNTRYCASFDITRHPWEEADLQSTYVTYPTPESTKSCSGSPEFEELNNEGLLLDMDIPLEMNSNELWDMIDENALESPVIPTEHNYHNPDRCDPSVPIKEEDDVGICLHVSQNKVSLEFCPSCSGSASQNLKAG